MNLLHFVRKQRAVVLLLLLAAALRIWYLSINPLWPQFSNADDGDYYYRALRLAVTGNYIDDSWLIRPPFHVWVFAAWLRVALLLGQPPAFGVRLIQAFQVGLGVLMVPLCYALAARLFNRRAGLWFAAFWAIWFPFVELPATLFSEPIYLFLFTLHLWLLLRFDATGRRRNLLWSGFVLGMAALTRSPALYALVFAVPWLLIKYRPRATGEGPLPEAGDIRTTRRSTQPEIASSIVHRPSFFQLYPSSFMPTIRRARLPLAVLALCTLAVVLPWTARNWIVYQRLILIDTLGPINLWLDLGAAEDRNAKIEQLRQLPQADRQSYATEQARTILQAEPLRPFRNVWPTFRHVWKAQYVEDFWVKTSFFTRPLREAAPLGLPGDLIWLLAVVTGVIGLLHPATDRAFKVLIGLWLLYSFATVLVFHVEPRYLLPIWLLLGLYGAWTLSCWRQWVGWLRRHRVRMAVVVGSVVLLIGLFVSYRNYPAIIRQGVQREFYMVRGDSAYKRADYAAAEREYRAALAVNPAFLDGQVALALALGAQNKPQDGLAVLTPGTTRRSVLVEGVLYRAANAPDQARALLQTIEQRTGEDTQRWALTNVRAEARTQLVLGDDALDLGYIAGFAESERAGTQSYRWLSGRGEIVLPLPQPLKAGAQAVIELAAPLALAGPVQVRLGNGPAVALQPDPQWRSYRFSIPPDLVGQQRLRVQLEAPTRLPMRDNPESSDARALSVMVHSVMVEQ